MSSLVVSSIVFGCVFGGALVALVAKRFLPPHHLATESKDVVKLGMGLIASLVALSRLPVGSSASTSFG